MRITLDDPTNAIHFHFSFHPTYSLLITQLPNPSWLPEEACWAVPWSPFAGWLTRRLFPDRSFYAPGVYDRLVPLPRYVPARSHSRPFPFQREGAAFLTVGNRLLHDEPGLGKTTQGLLAVQTPTVIVCPASVVYHWQREVRHLFPDRSSAVIHGRTRLPSVDYLIISPTLLRRRLKEIIAYERKSCIVDEIHQYRNALSKTTRALLALTSRTEHVVGLSGTLLYNQISDLFSALVAIGEFRYQDRDYFLGRFCGGRAVRKGQQRRQQLTHGEELREYLATCTLRRTRAQTGRPLPPLTHKVLHVPLADPLPYDRAREDIVQWLVQNTAAPEESKLIKFNKLRRLGAIGKVPAALAAALPLLRNGEKVIIASSFLEPLRLIHKQIPLAIRLDGGCSQQKRQRLVEYFQTTPGPGLALCSMKAAGVGITLTAAAQMFVLDLPWCPPELEQLEARIVRESQTRPTTVTYLLAPGTIDTPMIGVLERKADWSNRLWEGGDFPFALTLAAVAQSLRCGSTPAISTLPLAA